MSLLENFNLKSAKQITIRNELIPIGKTLENIQNNKILEIDSQRSVDYKAAKDIIDRFHRQFIELALTDTALDWTTLSVLLTTDTSALNDEQKEKLNESIASEQAKLRKSIHDLFENVESLNGVSIKFDLIFKKELIKEYLPKLLSGDEKKIIDSFSEFNTYFTGFHDTRKNVYSEDDICGSIAHRIINDNFPMFLRNIQIYQTLEKECPQILFNVTQELQKHNILLFNDRIMCLRDYFIIGNYNAFLTQKGIEQYNQIIGGIAASENFVKVRGLNEFINLQCQQNNLLRDKLKNSRSSKMNQLYKQILSDRESCFSIEAFSTDEDVINAVNKYFESISGELGDVVSRYIDFESKDYNFDKIYIGYKHINTLSKELYGGNNWSLIKDKIVEDKFKGKNKSLKNNEIQLEKNLSKQEFSIKYLNEIIGIDENLKSFLNRLTSYLNDKITDLLSIIKGYKNEIPCSLKSNREKTQIKTLLDKVLELQRIINFFDTETYDKDDALYQNYSKLGEIARLYNKVRNYATKKPYSLNKIKINFNSSQLAGGWSDTKINDHLSFLLLRDNKYYLAVLKKGEKINFNQIAQNNPSTNSYKRMTYLLFKGSSKMIPKCSTSCDEVKNYFSNPQNNTDFSLMTEKYVKPLVISKEIYEIYVNGLYKKEDKKGSIGNIDRRNCLNKWIDFGKEFLKSYGTTSKFDFSRLKPSCEYDNVKEFYDDVDNITYKIDYEYINEEIIDGMVESGKLYLFQIYNKDYSERSTGTKNLHTLYWKGVFESDNVIKLDGKAEVFYRKRSLDLKNKGTVIHRKGSFVLNRVTSDSRTIPENIYRSLLQKINDENFNEFMLSEEEMKFYDSLVKRSIDHDIIKDRRFTADKFFFHCPITINYKSNVIDNINPYVNKFLFEDKNLHEINIIGIDRGERNLLYVTVINQDGKILYNKSFNTIAQNSKQDPKLHYEVNYHDKLKTRERERDSARKSWDTIGKIATLKEGYLSAVVHEITKLIIKYNAIVVMENLNFNFKRIRGGIAERSVYQKFEKMLIDKLYYLVVKEQTPTEPFGIYNGRQLAGIVKSFKNIDNQVGFIFYVTAAYTSKIDPTTGFSNLFKFGYLKNASDYKNFFKKFDSISYDVDKKLFKYSFDYKNFEYVSVKPDKSAWEVYTYGTRIIKDKDRKDVDYDPTKKIIELFEQYSVDYKSSQNILVDLLNDDGKKYNESFWIKLFLNFKYTVQMRNSKTGDVDTDYLISPVINSKGYFFCTQSADSSLPNNADSNGAFHIALKGLMVLNRIYNSDITNMKKNDTKLCSITNNDWFNYVIKRN